jgi:serine/threonine-protein kinase
MTDLAQRLQTALATRYTVERELGRGGMATVYLAQDLKHGRPVAIKVLHPELAAVLGAERFLREIRLTANLQHPHILPLYDSGEAEGLLYYVMPFVAGETLRARLQRDHQLPIEDALRLTRNVALALEYAHQRGIIHRDIKPENILLEGEEAIVADFGIARAISRLGGDKLTETGLSVGTPAYMSPEQAAGDGELDARSDVYALGGVLFEMLAGEPPYTGPTAQVILARRFREPVPSVRVLRDLVAESVERSLPRRLLPRQPTDTARQHSLLTHWPEPERYPIVPCRRHRPMRRRCFRPRGRDGPLRWRSPSVSPSRSAWPRCGCGLGRPPGSIPISSPWRRSMCSTSRSSCGMKALWTCFPPISMASGRSGRFRLPSWCGAGTVAATAPRRCSWGSAPALVWPCSAG